MDFDRRAALVGGLALACAPLVACGRHEAPEAPKTDTADNDLRAALGVLEASSGGKIGLAVLDTGDGMLIGHRQDERFTMCSTFKLSLAAAVLAQMDAGAIAPNTTLPITRGDPVGHAPILRARLDAGKRSMTVFELAQAAQIQSDNGAANILLRKIGGPEALTAFWRSLGDQTSRLDRYEPELNTSHGGDPRDTTTAAAMARSLQAMLTGTVLKPASRERLIGWMVATQTGLRRLRGGLPAGWRAGDKTGTNPGDGSYAGKVNDLAIIWHPKRAEPFMVTAFLEAATQDEDGRTQDEAVLAEAGKLAASWIEARIA